MENDQNLEKQPDLPVSPGENTGNTGENSGEYKVGPYNPPLQTRFGTRPPPDPEKQKKTKARKKFERELFHELLLMKYNFEENSAIKKQLVDTFGPKVLKMPAGAIAYLRTIQKAISKPGANDLAQLFNQALGLPKQAMEHSGPGGAPIETSNVQRITKVIITRRTPPETNQA